MRPAMCTQGSPAPWRVRGALRLLPLTALPIAAVLLATADTLATAYPDSEVAPVCTDGAPATVVIYGGDVSNTTTLDLSANGGTAIGDASGGNENLATTS